MAAHALQYAIQGFDGLDDIRPLVEHDAFGSGRMRCIGNFSARGHPVFGHALQYLCGPDCRNMCGIAQADDLLLDFRQTLKSDFDGQIAACNHDSKFRMLHAGEEDVGQILKTLPGLDLEYATQNVLRVLLSSSDAMR